MDIRNIRTEKEAELMLAVKRVGFSEKMISDSGGVLYRDEVKDVAMWFRVDGILTIF